MTLPSVLHDAAKNGDEERVSALLRDGADIHAHNAFGWTPLTLAIQAGHVDCARLLMEHGANPYALDGEGQNALHWAAHRGQADAVRFLLRLGLPVNLPNAAGYTPLHLAAMRANRRLVIETASVLLASGAERDSRNGYGTTPLFSAAVRGSGELVDFLIAHGADVNVRSNDGGTILMTVVKIGMFPDMVERLMAHGAYVDAQDAEGRTALMRVAEEARTGTGVMDILLGAGADINLRDARGRTALIYAASEPPQASEVAVRRAEKWPAEKRVERLARAYHRRAETVRFLLGRGADARLRDAESSTALELALANSAAVGEDNAEVVAVLRESHAPSG